MPLQIEGNRSQIAPSAKNCGLNMCRHFFFHFICLDSMRIIHLQAPAILEIKKGRRGPVRLQLRCAVAGLVPSIAYEIPPVVLLACGLAGPSAGAGVLQRRPCDFGSSFLARPCAQMPHGHGQQPTGRRGGHTSLARGPWGAAINYAGS